MTRPVLLGVALLLLSSPGLARDWPTYRGNAQRDSYTTEELPGKLSLHWGYLLPNAPQPAWPSLGRMTFDRAVQPIVASGKVIFGSSADCRVYALDAKTGHPSWSFFTDGPIRFAPAAWRERVFVASDDGHLYALAIADGKLLWKRRGGPGKRMVLGNDRMISRWPARGGPVVVGDVVYFAAGIWPSEGITLYALDASSGKLRWKNDDSGSIYMPQPHGGANAYSGVAAQGHLVAAGDRLFMPTGRAVPAAFDRSNGKFKYFHLQKFGRYGSADLMVAEKAFINSGLLFDAEKGDLRQRLGAGAFAATADGVLHSTGTTLNGYRFADIKTKDRRGKTVEFRGLARTAAIKNVPGGTSLIVAGQTAVVGAKDALRVVDLKSQKVTHTLKIDGLPYGLAVADGCVFASTDQGTIYCFGEAAGEPMRVVQKAASPYGENAAFAAAAEEMIKRTNVTEGYCLDLGCGDGALAYELAKRTKLHIVAVDSDEKNVRAAREKLAAAGLYGVRVTVHHRPLADTGYPNYFADLIVSGRSVTEGIDKVDKDEADRLQRPAGGVACFGKPGTMKVAVRKALDGEGLWTHQYANPANTSCSDDKRVKGPLQLLWYRDADFEVPQRHGRGPAPLYHNGRVFHEGMNGLRAADAYNGRTLWEYSLPNILKQYDADHLMGTAGTGSNFCVAGDAVYVRVKDRCLRIATADGKKLGEFPVPSLDDEHAKEKKTNGIWGYIASEGGLLFGSVVDEAHIVRHSWRPADMNGLFTESVALFALDAKTGKPAWTYRAKHSIRHNAIAIGGGRVYLIDRSLAKFDRLKRRGEVPKVEEHPTGTLVVLDAKTGKVVWQKENDIYGTLLALSTRHDALLMSYQNTRFKLKSELGGRLTVFRASDGKRLWDKTAKYNTRPMINDLTIYTHGGAWDLLTGDARPFTLSKKSYGCGQLAGCENMMFYRSATLGYFDLNNSSRGTQNFGGIRPGCWINAIPAGGIVLVPDASSGCTCSYLNRAWIALEPAR